MDVAETTSHQYCELVKAGNNRSILLTNLPALTLITLSFYFNTYREESLCTKKTKLMKS